MTTPAATDDPVAALVARVEGFVREHVIPAERDSRLGPHGPSFDLVAELREQARAAKLIAPHIVDGEHLSHRDTARVLRAAGYSPLGPVALNVMAPDEGNMFLLHKVANAAQRARYLQPLVAAQVRSAFLMTEPDGGAGSDPQMLQTRAVKIGDGWQIDGRKWLISGADGATFGIVMARTSESGATMFLVDLDDPAIRIERVLDTLDTSMPGGHAVMALVGLRVPESRILGELHQGFRYAQLRLAPARLTHCMRWHGAAQRAQDIAVDYSCRRQAFGKTLVEHEGVGFMLADNQIELQQAELMIDWCAGVLDAGQRGTRESSMTKVAVSEALFRVADRCVQVLGGLGITRDTIVEQVFREMRAFRIYDGPSEVHRWSLARRLQRDWTRRSGGT